MYRHHIRLLMFKRGVDTKQLAALTGLSLGHVFNLISGTKKSKRGRELLEDALGSPVWSDPTEFLERLKQGATRARREANMVTRRGMKRRRDR